MTTPHAVLNVNAENSEEAKIGSVSTAYSLRSTVKRIYNMSLILHQQTGQGLAPLNEANSCLDR